jgi:hypothetical protein
MTSASLKLAAGAVLAVLEPDIPGIECPGMSWPDIGMDEAVAGTVEACSLGGLQAASAMAAAVPTAAAVAIDAILNMVGLLENWMG